jgi:EAL and modified HD-GYP domain-containing signal transduction protein
MLVYTARQAILNRRQNVSAYELFFRDGPENFFPQDMDPHEATSKLIGRTHFNKGIRPLTSGKAALINFSEESLLKRLPMLLPKEDILVEILETARPNDAVYNACAELYRAGYRLVLDDFVYKPEWRRFFKLVKMIKFDIIATPLDTIAPLVTKLRENSKIKLLAEKVETKEEFEQAMQLGFHFFQGYYFCKPEMQKGHEVESNELLLFSIYQETLRSSLNYKAIGKLLEQDSNLVYKLLCFVNSGGFPLQTKITSIKQSLTYLGDAQLRSLLSLFVTAILASRKPAELTKMCVVRAKFCQLVIKKTAPILTESAFLTGMFSLLNAILDLPMDAVLDRLPVSDEIKETLLDVADKSQTPISMTLRAIKLLESGSWYLAEREAEKLHLSPKLLDQFYQDAISWSEFFENNEEPSE